MLQAHEIQRALRLITSPEFKRANRFPIATIANLAGLHRTLLYRCRNGREITERVTNALGPILEAITRGEMNAERIGNRWQLRSQGEMFPCVEMCQMEKRIFPPRPAESFEASTRPIGSGRSVPSVRSRL